MLGESNKMSPLYINRSVGATERSSGTFNESQERIKLRRESRQRGKKNLSGGEKSVYTVRRQTLKK